MGKLTEALRQMIESLQISSASPGHINEVLQVDPSVDLDEEIKDVIEDVIKEKKVDGDSTTRKARGVSIKKEREIKDTKEAVDGLRVGNVGDIQKFSTAQFNNIRQLATSPFFFITGLILRRIGRGFVIGFLLALAAAIVKFVLDLLFAPGRPLDPRFKLTMDEQILAFTQRQEQQNLRRGFRTVIITTSPGLRGVNIGGLISGNLYRGPSYLHRTGMDTRLVTQTDVKRFDHRNKFRVGKSFRFAS